MIKLFNLKSLMLNELNCTNYVSLLRLGIHFLSEDIKNPCHFECPHRLSDKLLKSCCDALEALCREVAYIYAFPSFRVNPDFQDFFSSTDPGCLK